MAKKRKVFSAVFNAEDAKHIEEIRAILESREEKTYNNNQFIKFLLEFYMKNMDVTWFDAITKKPLGAPKKLKGKPGRPKDTGVS